MTIATFAIEERQRLYPQAIQLFWVLNKINNYGVGLTIPQFLSVRLR
ncbi:MAG: hypothetical protein WBA93_34145 [Microcoleaceae cyanobacterium]